MDSPLDSYLRNPGSRPVTDKTLNYNFNEMLKDDFTIRCDDTHSTTLSTGNDVDRRVFESINYYDYNPVGIEVFFHCKQM